MTQLNHRLALYYKKKQGKYESILVTHSFFFLTNAYEISFDNISFWNQLVLIASLDIIIIFQNLLCIFRFFISVRHYLRQT